MQCRARLDGDHYVLDGTKTWISNGDIADFYCVFARTQAADVRADGTSSAGGITAFVVDAGTPGLSIAGRIDIMAPHPMASLAFDECRIPAANRLGAEGEGFKIAMRTLDIFRTSVAAAALGFAQRALDESMAHVRKRRHVRAPTGRFSIDPGRAGRHGNGDRRRAPPHLSRGMAAGTAASG